MTRTTLKKVPNDERMCWIIFAQTLAALSDQMRRKRFQYCYQNRTGSASVASTGRW